jgi:hypothetical protein
MEIALVAVNVTLAIFVLGLAYNAGKHVHRLDALETWRIELRSEILEFKKELKSDMNAIHGHLARLEELITNP